ncbi:hypothetical protein FNF29_01143 [Cafeteria roenbergensis]|uniref:BZIP domain-containing protein n=1 Tax=Cafeteria roenbergensis TaxID=33653 RepID=A0A5A8CVX9_CAFRO|nr:hypothetical protein FNF29_01143 [Cafeteria roenbergensis]KAA0166464.1 hypothetical protein FNF28_03105 [Cafeteria roenbergensis]KAA0168453.1 hypothetical protein FNF31_00335 [Cafeteria roenbergensis]|eukprot:KAA0156350.1 hypothetical protein FNF29_01143 [Cafeteria roenbergensis]
MSSRRSTRIAVRGPSSSDFADGESSDSGPSGRSRARQSAISDDALATLSARGNVAASRMARNRESARKSRAGFSQRMATLQAEHQQLEESLSVTFARVSAELGEDRAQLAASRAAEAARASFVDDIPPKRASGSRTSITDEELRRRAAAGDVSAERMLSNRESARESRRRKWESWNSQRLRTEQVRASLRALQALCGSSSSPSTVVRSPGSPLRDGLPSSRDSVASVSTSGPASVAGTEDRFGDPGSARLAALHGAVEAARSASSAAPALPIAPFPSAATAEPVAGAATPSQFALIVTPSDSAEVDGA